MNLASFRNSKKESRASSDQSDANDSGGCAGAEPDILNIKNSEGGLHAYRPGYPACDEFAPRCFRRRLRRDPPDELALPAPLATGPSGPPRAGRSGLVGAGKAGGRGPFLGGPLPERGSGPSLGSPHLRRHQSLPPVRLALLYAPARQHAPHRDVDRRPLRHPASAQAAAVNITVFAITGAGSNGVFKVGTVSPPTTAWINYPPSETQRANAGVVALTGAGAIVVQVNQGAGSVDFVVDVNGYYAQPQGPYAHLLAVGGVQSNGAMSTQIPNLGTWTSSRNGVGNYSITFPGLRPGCVGLLPMVLPTPLPAGFAYLVSWNTACASGDVIAQIFTTSISDVATDRNFWFLAYAPSPVASALTEASERRLPSTCTFTVSTGVETCE